MMSFRAVAIVIAACLSGLSSASAQGTATADRLYAFDCGQGRAADLSRWMPGLNVGQPVDISDNCYLIKHGADWILWDTGIAEKVAAMPDGLVSLGGAMVWRRPKTMAEQFAAVGITPDDVKYVAVSHTHGDHVGNVDMFPKATLLIQKAEFDWAFKNPTPPFAADRPIQKLEGDLDVFGDGSVRIVSTPGHTPGHQSLMVNLAKTGWLLLSGDAAHFKDNYDNRRIPSMNTDRDQTVASMNRIADLVAQNKATFWINHDKPQSDTLRRPPAFYD